MTVSREQTQHTMDIHRAAAGSMMQRADWLVADAFEQAVEDCGDGTALIYEEQRLSWREIDQRAGEYGRVVLACGLTRGDSCAMMIENRPEFFYAWLGIGKMGAIPGLVNTSARDQALAHAVHTTGSRLLLVGDECMEQVREAGLLEDPNIRVIRIPDAATPAQTIPGGTPITEVDTTAQAHCDFRQLRQGITSFTPCCYIFTSGTTGLPKAAIISHGRFLATGAGWNAALGLSSTDVFYCALPLFHGAALMSLYSTALQAGSTIFLRRKFSVSRFWSDVQAHQVTVFQYVGEVCRYLVNRPPVPEERGHSLRFLLGSGMGADVWERFTERFGDHTRIIEGWGSTESNGNLSNFDQQPGSCGRLPFPERSHLRLLRFDQGTDELMRDSQGHYLLCQPGEVGEMYGQIQRSDGTIVAPFEGYTSREATEAKILRDVFEQGDAWWRSGDLFRYDDDGYFYFVDRIGDTFRWKGENVSTTEVAQQLSGYADAETVNVYGVKIPGHEGRACMAALALREGHSFNPAAFYRCATDKLPAYAQPLFVRVLQQADMTANYKLRKVRLREEGFDRSRVSDPVYGLDRESGCYSVLDDALERRLTAS